MSDDWKEDCMLWRGHVLTGKYGHWCPDWDDLPIDETCSEWPCACEPELRKQEEEQKASPRKWFSLPGKISEGAAEKTYFRTITPVAKGKR